MAPAARSGTSTLQFLGAVDDADALSAAVAAAVAEHAAFEVQLAGGGAFPTVRRGTVLWVGVERDDALAAPGRRGAGRDASGSATRPATGPSTRISPWPERPRAALADLVETIGTAPIGVAWTVTDVAVVESDTRPTGAVHTVRDRLHLRGA